jgi:hypothetical protein
MVRTDEPSPVFVATGLALDLALDDAIAGVRLHSGGEQAATGAAQPEKEIKSQVGKELCKLAHAQLEMLEANMHSTRQAAGASALELEILFTERAARADASMRSNWLKCEEAMREVLGAGRGVQAGEVEIPAMAAEAGRETR